MKTNLIHYGFGKDYLPEWGINEALREIYQNFLDYGPFKEVTEETNNTDVQVSLTNSWVPSSLDFLRIGNSEKHTPDAIGKHGEGLKMAFLILSREGFESSIQTPEFTVRPSYYIDKEIGECFCLEYEEYSGETRPFTIQFECITDVFREFKQNLITPDDVLFDDRYWGQIVNKPAGNIYSGGLFVTYAKGISKAYNIKPHHLPLDRDRSVPRAFDLNYAASKINEAEGKFEVADLSMSDTYFIQKVPERVKEQITPVIVGNSIEFTVKTEDGTDKVICNSEVKAALIKDSFFTASIKKLKLFLAKQLGLYDLLVEFKEKHVHDAEARMDFDMILERVSQNSRKEVSNG